MLRLTPFERTLSNTHYARTIQAKKPKQLIMHMELLDGK